MPRALLTILLAATATAQQIPSITLPPGPNRVLRDYERAWTAKDPKALATLFTEDGFVLSQGKPMVRGRAAIEAAYKGAGGPLFLRPVGFSADGNTGFIIGAYAQEPNAPDMGKFTLTLKKAGDRWLIHSDMDNSNKINKISTQN